MWDSCPLSVISHWGVTRQHCGHNGPGLQTHTRASQYEKNSQETLCTGGAAWAGKDNTVQQASPAVSKSSEQSTDSHPPELTGPLKERSGAARAPQPEKAVSQPTRPTQRKRQLGNLALADKPAERNHPPGHAAQRNLQRRKHPGSRFPDAKPAARHVKQLQRPVFSVLGRPLNAGCRGRSTGPKKT